MSRTNPFLDKTDYLDAIDSLTAKIKDIKKEMKLQYKGKYFINLYWEVATDRILTSCQYNTREKAKANIDDSGRITYIKTIAIEF